MTDELAQVLRGHLMSTADERPAEQQLEAVLARTAQVTQRPPWLTRLRSLPEVVIPSRRAALRYALVASLLLIVVAAIAMLGGGSRPVDTTPFEGRWSSIDTADGSAQLLVVEAGPSPAVHFEDGFSINCQRNGDSSTVYHADGPGQIQANRLIVQFPSGGCVSWQVRGYLVYYDYDEATHTLLDYQGITWQKAP